MSTYVVFFSFWCGYEQIIQFSSGIDMCVCIEMEGTRDVSEWGRGGGKVLAGRKAAQ